MKKYLTLILICAITIGLTLALMRYMRLDSFAFAWALNFMLMLCVHIFIDALKSQLKLTYFDDRKWERKGKIYEYIGINLFRKLLVLIGWEKLIRKGIPIEKSAEAMANLYYQTKKSELGHLIIWFIVLGFTIFVAVEFGVIKSLWLLIFNTLFNLYPVLLQRYNRPRIARAIKLGERRA